MPQSELPTLPVHAPPGFPTSVREVLSIHLHRYLAPGILEADLHEIRVILGFDGSAIPSLALAIRLRGTEELPHQLNFTQLASGFHAEEAYLRAKAPGFEGDSPWQAFPLVDDRDEHTQHVYAFLLLPAERKLNKGLRSDLLSRLREALRAFRNNSIRMLFHERDQMGNKTFLYQLLNQLPSWCGVDHSAAVLLPSNLEAMALDSRGPARFEIIAERLYFPRDTQHAHKRLVGLAIEVDPQKGCQSLICHALKATLQNEKTQLNIFVAGPDCSEWTVFGEPGAIASRFSTNAPRPLERMTVLLPLLAFNELEQRELLGFLSINYRDPGPISPLTSEVLISLAEHLARYLKRSSVFNLSARQLLLLNEVRNCYESKLQNQVLTSADLDATIGEINKRFIQSTGIPCFAIGRVIEEQGRDVLRFANPQGFTHFDDIDLDIAAHEDIKESSVATLALRLGRPVVLVGTPGPSHENHNQLLVNEAEKRLVDARRVTIAEAEQEQWRPLLDYYKPSRDQSYATLAYPIIFGSQSLGVIALEVDKNTDWRWWSGFASTVFYQLLANELATLLRS